MKIRNHLVTLIIVKMSDVLINGLVGRLVSSVTTLAFAYHVSVCSSLAVRCAAACLLIVQALLYQVHNPVFYLLVLLMLITAGQAHKLLRPDGWVRGLVCVCYSILLALFYTCAYRM